VVDRKHLTPKTDLYNACGRPQDLKTESNFNIGDTLRVSQAYNLYDLVISPNVHMHLAVHIENPPPPTRKGCVGPQIQQEKEWSILVENCKSLPIISCVVVCNYILY
jgi:hypothetical protein